MKLNKGYKTKLKNDFLISLGSLIEQFMSFKWEYDEDKLFISALSEVKLKLHNKIGTHQGEYTMTFTPAQAFALRILFNDYVAENLNPKTAYLYHRLQQMSSEIHRQYNN